LGAWELVLEQEGNEEIEMTTTLTREEIDASLQNVQQAHHVLIEWRETMRRLANTLVADLADLGRFKRLEDLDDLCELKYVTYTMNGRAAVAEGALYLELHCGFVDDHDEDSLRLPGVMVQAWLVRKCTADVHKKKLEDIFEEFDVESLPYPERRYSDTSYFSDYTPFSATEFDVPLIGVSGFSLDGVVDLRDLPDEAAVKEKVIKPVREILAQWAATAGQG
jgi:hypothetical protein